MSRLALHLLGAFEASLDGKAVTGFKNGRNAPAIIQVCQHLDGRLLALELAAARVKMLSVEEIAGYLDDRFRLLTGGSAWTGVRPRSAMM